MRIAVVGGFRSGNDPAEWLAEAFEQNGHRVMCVREARLAGSMGDHRWLQSVDMLVWSRSHLSHVGARQRMLDTAKELGVPTVGFHPDLFWGLSRETEIGVDPFFQCDWVITTDGGHDDLWVGAGVNHMWHPPVARRADTVLTPEPVPGLAGKAVFVGAWERYPHVSWPWRMQLIRELKRTFGPRFVCYPVSDRRTVGAPVYGQGLANIISSAGCVVGDTCHAGTVHNYWSDRVPITLGMGGVLVHPEISGMDNHYRDGEHLVTVPPCDMDAMIATVARILADGVDPELRVRAQATVRDDYTYHDLANDMLTAVQGGW